MTVIPVETLVTTCAIVYLVDYVGQFLLSVFRLVVALRKLRKTLH